MNNSTEKELETQKDNANDDSSIIEILNENIFIEFSIHDQNNIVFYENPDEEEIEIML